MKREFTAILMLLSIVITGGCALSSGENELLGIKRDQAGYPCIQSISDVYKACPLTIEQIEAQYEMVTETASREMKALTQLGDQEMDQEHVLIGLDKILACVGVFIAAVETVHFLSPEKEVRQAATDCYRELQKFFTDLVDGNRKLYQLLKKYAQEKAPKEDLSPERDYFLKEMLAELELEGLALPEQQFKQVLEVKKELADVGVEFEVNIAQDNRTLTVKKDALKGLSEEFIKTLAREGEGYILRADYPTQDIVMRECADGATRKSFRTMMAQRGYPKNVEVLQRLIGLRKRLATLLGFESYADLALARAMVNSVPQAWKLQEDLLPLALKKAQKELETFSQDLPEGVKLSEDGRFYPWDFSYVVNHFKKKHYKIDESEIAQYFPMEHTIRGLLNIYERFFDLKFKEVKDPKAWHPEVRLLEVKVASGQLLGYVYLDMFPRENKYSHAAHLGIVSTRKNHDGILSPGLSVLICNFTPSSGDKPSLLKYSEVNTFFHEFGHALHSLMGATELAAQAGTSVKRDFVEMPSQMLENWLEDKEILRGLSKHYKTGESLPEKLIDKKLELLKLTTGIFESRQIGLGMLSLDLFDEKGSKDLDEVSEYYSKKTSPYFVFDPNEKSYCSFGHLASYGPKYYGYLWTRILAADLFQFIQEEGLLNSAAGKRYADAILVPGGSKAPSQLVREYLGREPSQVAYLARNGFQE